MQISTKGGITNGEEKNFLALKFKKMTVLAVGLMALGGTVLHPTSAIAAPIPAPSETLDWGQQLNASDTSCPSGKPVLNVVRKVINSLDSQEGPGSNDDGFGWRAVIDYVQQIRVVETAPGEFCATVESKGNSKRQIGLEGRIGPPRKGLNEFSLQNGFGAECCLGCRNDL